MLEASYEDLAPFKCDVQTIVDLGVYSPVARPFAIFKSFDNLWLKFKPDFFLYTTSVDP